MIGDIHKRSDDLLLYWVPADVDVPMELKLVPNRLESLQQFVGGYIERVATPLMLDLRCGCRTVMLVDEEGLIRGKDFNPRASVWYPSGYGIRGDAVILAEGLIEADRTSHSYDPGDPPEPDFMSLPTAFNDWQGPGTPSPE